MNREIAKIFNKIALILELDEVKWKPQAYRNAARSLENLGEDVDEIYKKSGLKGLEEIPDIGENLAKKIVEYINTGKIKKYEELKKKYPSKLLELVELEGLGPKKVKILYKKLGIKSLEDLKKAIKNHKLRNLEGFGEKTEENLIKNINIKVKSEKRMPINYAFSIANEIMNYLKENCKIQKINYAGSLRRMKETIGDIDLLAVSNASKDVMNKFTNMNNVKRVLLKGTTRSTIILKDNTQVDIRVFKEEEYPAALLYFTGNKQHNIELRKVAIKKGYKLNEYGLFKRRGKKIKVEDEEEIYKKLGFSYIPPEMRENRGELELAKKGRIPKLIELKDIKGDLHIHTKHSDGKNSIEEIAEYGEKLNYKYIAITNHSKSSRIARGLDEKELKNMLKGIDKIKESFKIKILKGSEVDILKNGKLDYSDKVLKNLDVVIAAIHSNFKMPKAEMTERILKALKNRYVKILAHPTSRLIGSREGIEADWEKIFEVASENNKIIEINASPDRLDLNDNLIFLAKEKGVKFVINTDSHDKENLKNMFYGVGMARRGWLTKKEVINTYPYRKLLEMLS